MISDAISAGTKCIRHGRSSRAHWHCERDRREIVINFVRTRRPCASTFKSATSVYTKYKSFNFRVNIQIRRGICWYERKKFFHREGHFESKRNKSSQVKWNVVFAYLNSRDIFSPRYSRTSIFLTLILRLNASSRAVPLYFLPSSYVEWKCYARELKKEMTFSFCAHVHWNKSWRGIRVTKWGRMLRMIERKCLRSKNTEVRL